MKHLKLVSSETTVLKTEDYNRMRRTELCCMMIANAGSGAASPEYAVRNLKDARKLARRALDGDDKQ